MAGPDDSDKRQTGGGVEGNYCRFDYRYYRTDQSCSGLLGFGTIFRRVSNANIRQNATPPPPPVVLPSRVIGRRRFPRPVYVSRRENLLSFPPLAPPTVLILYVCRCPCEVFFFIFILIARPTNKQTPRPRGFIDKRHGFARRARYTIIVISRHLEDIPARGGGGNLRNVTDCIERPP